MEKKAVLISKGGFLAISIKEALIKKDIEVVEVEPSILSLEANRNTSDIIIILLNDYSAGDASMLERLKDICWNKKKLFVLGETSELKEFKKVIPAAITTKEFVRPFNTSDIVNSINYYFSVDALEETLPKILIIDDDPTFLWTIKESLSDTYSVKVASSGMEGISILAKEKPDPILLDYEMPVVNGDTVLQMLNGSTDTRNIPVMFLTGKDDKATVMKLLSLKPAGYLLKTLSPLEIHIAVDDFMAKSILDNS